MINASFAFKRLLHFLAFLIDKICATSLASDASSGILSSESVGITIGLIPFSLRIFNLRGEDEAKIISILFTSDFLYEKIKRPFYMVAHILN